MTTINACGNSLSGIIGSGSFIGSSSENPNTFLAGPISGSASNPTFRSLSSNDYNFSWAEIANNGVIGIIVLKGNNLISSASRTGTGIVQITFSTAANNSWLCVANAVSSSNSYFCTTIMNSATTTTIYTWSILGLAVDVNFTFYAFPV